MYKAVGISGRDTNAKLSEGGINLVFLPELQLRLGKIRIPFTRDQQEARYSYIIQTDWIYDPQGLFDYWRNGLLRLFDGGANLHGELLGGVVRYDVGIFNQASDDEPLNSVAWAARLEFSPPILGFKPETKTTGRGWLHDTYLGKRGDVLSIGLSYFTQDVAVGDSPPDFPPYGTVLGGALLPGGSKKELDVDAYNIDVFLEKKLGPAVINLEGAYVYFDDSHLGYDSLGKLTKKEDSYYWYIQGQILYDQVVGIGKPALYAKYEYIEADNLYYDYDKGKRDDYEMYRVAVGLNYYIQGNAARLTAGVDFVSYDDGAEDYLKEKGLEDNITDYYVQAQIMF